MPKYSVTHQASPLFQMGFPCPSRLFAAGACGPSSRIARFFCQTSIVTITAAPHTIKAPCQPHCREASGTFSASASAAAATMETVK